MSETQLEYKEWIIGVFDRAAPTYDRVGPRIWSHFGNRLIDLAGLYPGASVLDVGCGRGAILLSAAEKVGSTGCVVGIDQSEGMVKETAAEIERLGLSNAELHLMDAEDGLLFADDHFDFVFCAYVLYYFDDLDRALSECARVLKPKGRFLASTWGREFDKRWDGFRRIVRSFRDRLSPEPESNTRGLRDPAEIEEVLSKAGLVDIEVEAEKQEFYFQGEDDWWAFEWSHGNRSMWERMEPSALEECRQEEYEWIRQLRGERGIPMWMQMLLTKACKP
jgi:ubiquinone/menaquinone biosynthesis C-methylase UbiE